MIPTALPNAIISTIREMVSKRVLRRLSLMMDYSQFFFAPHTGVGFALGVIGQVKRDWSIFSFGPTLKTQACFRPDPRLTRAVSAWGEHGQPETCQAQTPTYLVNQAKPDRPFYYLFRLSITSMNLATNFKHYFYLFGLSYGHLFFYFLFFFSLLLIWLEPMTSKHFTLIMFYTW